MHKRDAINELLKAAVSIAQSLLDDIESARRKYDHYVESGKQLRLVARDRNNWERPVTEEEKEAASMANEAIQEQFRAKGRETRKTALLALANNLEALRAILPQLAAKAAIEAGVIARALTEEANANDETV